MAAFWDGDGGWELAAGYWVLGTGYWLLGTLAKMSIRKAWFSTGFILWIRSNSKDAS